MYKTLKAFAIIAALSASVGYVGAVSSPVEAANSITDARMAEDFIRSWEQAHGPQYPEFVKRRALRQMEAFFRLYHTMSRDHQARLGRLIVDTAKRSELYEGQFQELERMIEEYERR